MGPGTEIDYTVYVGVADEFFPWTAWLSVLMPVDWTILSCEHEGMDAGGVHYHEEGMILEPPFPPDCDCGFDPPAGYVMGCIQSQEHDRSTRWAIATVHFNVDRSPGEYTLGFRLHTVAPNYSGGDEYYVPVTVIESLLFGDSFESGDTTVWSATVP